MHPFNNAKNEIAAEYGFVIQERAMTLYGVCHDCQSQTKIIQTNNTVARRHMSLPTTLETARRLSVAPMLDWTDRHCRYFHRLLSKNVLLYTEMVNVNAILHGDAHRHLDFNAAEHPIVLQLGGSEPDLLARLRQNRPRLGL